MRNNVSNEQLAEVLAGLENLPHGPWFSGVAEGQNGTAGLAQVDNGAEMWPVIAEWPEAEHIARCDPDTIRAMILELQELRAHPLPNPSPSDGEVSDMFAVYDAAIAAYEAATPPDYRYSATALRRAVDAAFQSKRGRP